MERAGACGDGRWLGSGECKKGPFTHHRDRTDRLHYGGDRGVGYRNRRNTVSTVTGTTSHRSGERRWTTGRATTARRDTARPRPSTRTRPARRRNATYGQTRLTLFMSGSLGIDLNFNSLWRSVSVGTPALPRVPGPWKTKPTVRALRGHLPARTSRTRPTLRPHGPPRAPTAHPAPPRPTPGPHGPPCAPTADPEPPRYRKDFNEEGLSSRGGRTRSP